MAGLSGKGIDPPTTIRLCDMAQTVSGGIRSGAAPAETDSDDELYAAGFAESEEDD